MALKVYGGCYDGKNRIVVAATSFSAAHEAVVKAGMNGSFISYRNFTSVTGNPKEVEVAMREPGTVFTAKNDYHGAFRPLTPSPM